MSPLRILSQIFYKNTLILIIELITCTSSFRTVLQYRSDLGKLEYLTMCIKEGMRMHSPVPGISRVNSQPIKVDEYSIPQGSVIIINLFALHHNPAVWGEDHMEFKPERFNRENSEKRDSFAFFPFSAGPRFVFRIRIQTGISIWCLHVFLQYQ